MTLIRKYTIHLYFILLSFIFQLIAYEYYELPYKNAIPLSRGNVVIASGSDTSSLDYNPAGISQLYFKELSAMYNNLYGLSLYNGFISFAKTVTADQVREMLDPFPRDVVASEVFTLTTIPIDMVRPIGERYIPCSQSLGPILVDVNEVMRDHYDDPYLIIEGKHRWLDAKERGEGTIMAWVGNKVDLAK